MSLLVCCFSAQTELAVVCVVSFFCFKFSFPPYQRDLLELLKHITTCSDERVVPPSYANVAGLVAVYIAEAIEQRHWEQLRRQGRAQRKITQPPQPPQQRRQSLQQQQQPKNWQLPRAQQRRQAQQEQAWRRRAELLLLLREQLQTQALIEHYKRPYGPPYADGGDGGPLAAALVAAAEAAEAQLSQHVPRLRQQQQVTLLLSR